MQKITVSTPGKLMLLGEHAVVYNRPCLVTAVDQRMRVTVEIIDKKEFQLEAPDVNISNYKKSLKDIGKGDIPKGTTFVELAVKNTLFPLPCGIKITTSSEFSSQFGFGSSSASTVCVIKALSELFDLQLSQRQIFDIAYKTVLNVQGKGSGFDVAAGVFGGTIYFVTGGEIIESLPSSPSLIVGYSGIKADTVALIHQVKTKAEKYPEIIEEIYNSIEDVVLFAKNALLDNNWQAFGELMNINQGYLESLGVSSSKLSAMIYAARDAGAYGAKLSGAGGGDCMIAVAPEEKRKAVENAIIDAEGEIIHGKTNAEGVRIEE